jgi:hypothetical protein
MKKASGSKSLADKLAEANAAAPAVETPAAAGTDTAQSPEAMTVASDTPVAEEPVLGKSVGKGKRQYFVLQNIKVGLPGQKRTDIRTYEGGELVELPDDLALPLIASGNIRAVK